MNTLTTRIATIATAAALALAGLVFAAPASAAPSTTVPCPWEVTSITGESLRMSTYVKRDCTYRYAAPSAERVCEWTVEGDGVVLRLLSFTSRDCTYRSAVVGVPVEPVVEAPAPEVTVPRVEAEPEPEVIAPAPVAPSPITPAAPVVQGVLAAKYAQFASTYPGTSAYVGDGNCVARNFGFVQNGTFGPSFDFGSGVRAEVKITVNTARTGYDVQWYGCF